MDAVVVGVLTSVTVALGTLLWYLLVRPDVLLSIFRGGDGITGEPSWFDEDSSVLRALQVATGTVLFLLGFITGVAVAFLAVTR